MNKASQKNESEHAFVAHMAEYNSTRNEIRQQLGFMNQSINYSIVFIGGGAAILLGNTDLILQQPSLLLIGAIFLSAIGLACLESLIWVGDLSKYEKNVLVPKIQKIIGWNSRPEYMVLRWEETRRFYRGRQALILITTFGKFSISSIGSIICIALFYITTTSNNHSWLPIESILFWLAVFLSILHVLIIILNGLFTFEIGSKPYINIYKSQVGKDKH